MDGKENRDKKDLRDYESQLQLEYWASGEEQWLWEKKLALWKSNRGDSNYKKRKQKKTELDRKVTSLVNASSP